MRPDRSALHGARTRSRPSVASAPARVEASSGPAEREALMRVAAAAAAATRLEDVIELAAEAAAEALPTGSFAISKWDRENDVMKVLINVGELGPEEVRLPRDETYALSDFPSVARLLRTGVSYFTAVDDPEAEPASVALLRRLGRESDIGVPVVVGEEVWGELWASTSIGAARFRAEDVRFLEAVAAQLAGVIGRAELFSDVSRLAYEDPLTGLANRRAFEERMEVASRRCQEARAPLTLLLCDLDDLKGLNDSRGHHAGDHALRRVGESLVAAAAPFADALVARLAGDEFAVLIEDAGVDAARTVAATAHRLLEEGGGTALTVSCGAAAAVGEARRYDGLLRAADSAQYAAKRRGGGQLCTADASGNQEWATVGPQPRRRRLGDRLDAVAQRMLDLVRGDLEEHGALDRLEVVTSAFAEALNAAAWTVSFAERGSEELQTLSTADDRDGRLKGIRLGLENEIYELPEYPTTARLIEAGGGSFHVDSQDLEGDPAERRLLDELGFSAVLGVAVPDVDGVYLLELYADQDSDHLPAADLRLQLVARAVTGRSPAATAHMRRAEKRGRQLAVAGSLGARLAGSVDGHEIASAAVEELHAELGDQLCAIARLDGEGGIRLVAARGAAAEPLLADGWGQPEGLGLIGRALRQRDVVVCGDVRLEPDYRDTDHTRATRSELCAPLWEGDRLWGAIDIEDLAPDAFDEDDLRLVRTVADQVSTALRSAALYTGLERAYLGTAEALGAALEAKDSYTARHSRSIAANAEAVGRALGLTEEELRHLRFGVALHDIGKLAIPGRILNKRGPLDDEERARIEQHTVIGEQILEPIDFLSEVRPIVRAGHERWDGNGYPDGLAGESIPLAARIVFACDAFDAMTTDRPYRQALSRTVAMQELETNAGSQFDPQVVETLLQVLGGRA